MNMRSARRGARTSGAEVTNVSVHGFWVLVSDRELFVPFAEFPWFGEAPIAKLVDVEFSPPDHLYWPALDIDLSVDSILDPRRFPLVSRATVEGKGGSVRAG
jgi:hypothetical protein